MFISISYHVVHLVHCLRDEEEGVKERLARCAPPEKEQYVKGGRDKYCEDEIRKELKGKWSGKTDIGEEDSHQVCTT